MKENVREKVLVQVTSSAVFHTEVGLRYITVAGAALRERLSVGVSK